MSFHVIVGAGPIGTGTALQLVDRGHQVRIITRSGSGPSHDRIELVAADATDVARLVELSEGAHSLYNCANPPYDKWPTAWPPLSASLIRAA
ncbi:MAG: NAD-dependent epimerase, partial [Actinomycetia bacterium]|nr:NAD-dependent epimerase [Actinomycetes bacterium]